MFWQHNSLTAVVWQDKRPVHVLSTLSQPGDTAKVSRRQRDGSVAEVSCPSAILTYTKYILMYPLQTHLYLVSYVIVHVPHMTKAG